MKFAISAILLLLIAGSAAAEPNYNSVGFIFNSIKNDRVFNSLAGQAITKYEADTGSSVRQRAAPLLSDTERAIRELADRGIGTLLLLGNQHTPVLKRIAAEYPKVRFTIIDGVVVAPNVRSIVFREDEAGYLVGTAAAAATRTGRIGFIGAVPIPPVQRFACGFYQGALARRPDLAVTVRYLMPQGDGFREAGRARAVAEAMIADGVDVIFPAAGIAGHAALSVVAQAGLLGIGVDSNQNADHPGRILTSALKRVDAAVAKVLLDTRMGSWKPGVVELGLAEGAVDWAWDSDNHRLVAGFAAQVEAVKTDIITGRIELKPYTELPACANG